MSGYTRSVAKKTVGGFTLVELLIGLLILSLISVVGLPNLNILYERHNSRTTVLQFAKALHFARAQALQNNTNVTVCTLTDQKCSNNWRGELSIFMDFNSNSTLDDDEIVLRTIPSIDSHGYWSKKKAKRPFVRFDESGHAFSSATTFLYCPYSSNAAYARQLIISFQGRVRTAHYLNSSGKPYSAVNPLSCPKH